MWGPNILVLAPHPDDEIVGCGAAIARALAAGSRVRVLYLTTGVPRRLWPWQSYERRVEDRRREAEAVREQVGFEAGAALRVPSRGLKDALDEARAAVAQAASTVADPVLWVPAFEGGHQDHDSANVLASLFKPRLAVFEFSEYNNARGRTRSQEFPKAHGDEIRLTLSEAEAAEKRRLLALYASERGNLLHIRAGRETFRPLPTHDYSRKPHEGTLFYERFQWVPYHPRVDPCPGEEVCARLAAYALRESGRGGGPT
jgi:LmbE family N-acetylglucosaminyl deacetylase